MYLELDFVDPEQFPVPQVPWTPLYPFVPSGAEHHHPGAGRAAGADAQPADGGHRQARQLQPSIDDLHGQLSAGDAHSALADAAGLMKGLRGDVEAADVAGLLKELRATVEDAHATVASLRGTFDGKATKNL